MPIDGIMLHALRDELSDHAGARLDRITQPERDEVVLYFYSKGEYLKDPVDTTILMIDAVGCVLDKDSEA
ncbi:MAG: hypothetical protein IIX85_03650, partial [Clostridia bacterium]|nr:hypothetical protein [Clostridia bacterium]